jgi:GAF domain
MVTNQWLAVDATTPLLARARELRQAWEQFVGDGEAAAVRAPIALSWERSHAAGVDPFRAPVAPTVGDADEVSDRWDVHPLAATAPLILECLGPVAGEAEDLIVVSDSDGTLLWVEGRARARLLVADTINFTEGARWSETGAGTNAIGVALAEAHAVQVFAAEHFNEGVQPWTCAAAPVQDPDSGQLLGIVNLTGRVTSASPHSFTCVVATAHAVEAYLRSAMQERDFRLRSRYGDLIAGREQLALVTPTGRVLTDRPEDWLGGERLLLPPGGGELVLPSGVRAFAEPVGRGDAYVVRNVQSSRAGGPRPRVKLRLLGRDRAVIELDGRTSTLTRRLTELIALLASRPAGMTSEELAADLYGDAGQPGAARVEVYRLRKALGGAIETDPYRLTIDVESDIARIRGLLDRGAIGEAAARYEGPLLPRSEAPGIVRDREALDAWLRNAVMTSDDAEALWAWVQCPSGRDDLPAWKRLLAELDFRDPRRSRAASEVGSLRAAHAVS